MQPKYLTAIFNRTTELYKLSSIWGCEPHQVPDNDVKISTRAELEERILTNQVLEMILTW